MSGYKVGDRFLLPNVDGPWCRRGVEWYEITGFEENEERIIASPRNSGLLCGFSSRYLHEHAVFFDEALSMIEDATLGPRRTSTIEPVHGVHWTEVEVGDYLWVDDSHCIQVTKIDTSDMHGHCHFGARDGWVSDSRLKGVVFDD